MEDESQDEDHHKQYLLLLLDSIMNLNKQVAYHGMMQDKEEEELFAYLKDQILFDV